MSSLEHVTFEEMTLHICKRDFVDRYRNMGVELREKISIRKISLTKYHKNYYLLSTFTKL